MPNFENQRVLVTGGTRGIGRAISLAFLEAKATVVATYNKNEEAAAAFKAEYPQYAEKLTVSSLDVSSSRSINDFFATLETKLGGLEILVNNAGIRNDAALAMMDETQWHKVLQTNLTGSFLTAQKAVHLFMKNRFGRIINMSSVGARLSLSGQANYAASKAGLEALTKTLSKEVGKKGITVNSIAPGFIETDLLNGLSDKQISDYKKMVPVRRFGTPEEVARTVLFLADPLSGYITGTSIEISGGL